MIVEATTPIKHYTEVMRPGFVKHFIDFYDEDGKPRQIIFHHLTSPDIIEPHDHNRNIRCYVIEGGYDEEIYGLDKDGKPTVEKVELREGIVNDVKADTVHRIVHLPTGEAWTIPKYGPEERKPGFYRFGEGEVCHRYFDESEFKCNKPE